MRASVHADEQSRVALAAGTRAKMPDLTPRAAFVFLLLGSCLRDKLDWELSGEEASDRV